MDGLLVIDKPPGPTSHDVVARMRRVLGERRIGHTGTLNPIASGVLPLVLGRATRLARFLSGADKSYDATIRLGIDTDTYDSAGVQIGEPWPGPYPSRDVIDRALDACRGTFLQQPPAFSAKKIGGRRSYRLARAGRAMNSAPPALPASPALPDPVSVTTQAIDIVSIVGDSVTISVSCSTGFYVRALAHDLGERLGTGAHLTALRRTRIGDITLGDALSLEAAERSFDEAAAHVIPLSRLLPRLPAVVLTPQGVQRALHGRELGPADSLSGFAAGASEDTRDGASAGMLRGSPGPAPGPTMCRLVDSDGELVGIAQPAARNGLLHPSIVLM